MLVKNIIDEDFVNYKKPSMYIAMPTCSWKCCVDCGLQIDICQNSPLARSPNIEISIENVIQRYLTNPITTAVVFSGLEPFDNFATLNEFIKQFRLKSLDDIVIYTGYNKHEIFNYIVLLSIYQNIIIKYGRYIPNQNSRYDEVLGINLISDNQYAEKIT